MKRWSKLQKQLYLLIDPSVNLQIHCARYRMQSQRGNTDLPRYWITLDRNIIWDYPKDFIDCPSPDRTNLEWYPYSSDVHLISNLIRDYIDTSKDNILREKFENDHWGLINILRAADRRLGTRSLEVLRHTTHNRAALQILDQRK